MTTSTTDRTGRYYIAPAAEPADPYAAGYDANCFATEADAEACIADLADATGTDESAWVVSQYEDVNL